MQYKPIVVINEYPPVEYFDDIHLAEKHKEQWGGQIYRRDDWYQAKCEQVDELIRESLKND